MIPRIAPKSFLIFYFLLPIYVLHGQDEHAFFYPMNIGDYWEYIESPQPWMMTLEVIGDSAMPDGQDYRVLKQDYFGRTDLLFRRIDEQNNLMQFVPHENEAFLYLKLDIVVGDRWNQYPPSDSLYLNVVQISDTTFWNRTLKYARIDDSADLAPNTYFLTDSIGIYFHGFEGGRRMLTGAIIDGKQFGNISGVDNGETFRPIHIALKPNYPNPFNAETKISYEIPLPGFVTLEIHNLLGQGLRTLLKSEMVEGTHSVIWNGKDNSGRLVSSGIYVYRLRFESRNGVETRVRKLLLLK